MPDITMCKDYDCKLKETCYRYTAKPDYYQSYFVGSPKDEYGECGYYWGDNQNQMFEQIKDIVNPNL